MQTHTVSMDRNWRYLRQKNRGHADDRHCPQTFGAEDAWRVLAESEELVGWIDDSTSGPAEELRAAVERVSRAVKQALAAGLAIAERHTRSAHAADAHGRVGPWQALALASGAALAVGLLLMRR